MSETRTPLEDHCAGIALLQRKAAHFDALRSALREMYEQCDSLEDFKYSRDIPPQEAADNWADARYAARKALAAADEIGGD